MFCISLEHPNSMRKLLAIFALIATLVGCNKQQDGLDVLIGGPVQTPISVSIDETRAAGVDSAEGIFEQGILTSDDVTLRYILQIYIDGVAADMRLVEYSDTKSVEFMPTLIPGRDYKFVVWADVVTKAQGADKFTDTDNHYVTKSASGKSTLDNITLKGDWNAMDETRDAFTGFVVKNNFTGGNVTINLTRPFAKLRIVATDKENATATPVKGIVRYTSNYSEGFDAVAGKAKASSIAGKIHEYALDTYTNDSDESYTLFTDYLFANDGSISLTFEFYEEGVSYPIMNKTYTANDVSIVRNSITTIKGQILTGDETIEIGDSHISVTEWGAGGEVLIPGIVQ